MHRSDENYNPFTDMSEKELEQFLEDTKDEPVSLYLWGVGDHGGGPSRVDLTDVTKLIKERAEELEIIHSNPEAYFKERKAAKTSYPVVEKSLNPVAEGCYTSQVRVKQKHRLLENEIFSRRKRWRRRQSCYTVRNIRRKRFTKQFVHCCSQSFMMHCPDPAHSR